MAYLELGPTPGDEECAQVGADDYGARVRREGRAYIAQLTRQFGEPPEGCHFSIKGFPHDFGTYHEVVVHYEPEIAGSLEFAFKVERELPSEWDKQAKAELAPDTVLARSHP